MHVYREGTASRAKEVIMAVMPELVIGKSEPAEIDMQIGSLVIRALRHEGKPPSTAVGTTILVDGKPMAVRNIVIRGGVDMAWTCEMEFFP